MSEIIDTGLGWMADELWLRNTPGSIGNITGSGLGPEIPVWTGSAPTAQDCVEHGFRMWHNNLTGVDVYLLVSVAGVNAVEYGASSVNTHTVLPISLSPFTVYRGTTTGVLTEYESVNYATNPPIRYYYGYPLTYHTSDITINAEIPTYSGKEAATEAWFAGGTSTDFYKLASGYSVCCFMRWINANLQQMVAPILVSTDQNYVPISVDGTTPAPGLVTGVNFGGTTFYVNILLGHDGAVTSSVPYADITNISQEGINIEGLFRAIVVLARIRLEDPYAGGGTSEPGGGGGTFDLNSDDVSIPPLPTLSFAATGFTRIYNPTLTELNALANYLWTDTTFLNTVANHLKQLIENPIDAIISLGLLPCSIPNGSPEAVKVMYINTGVMMSPATTQFVDVDCGTYTLQEFYGSALDYNPYTKVHCYLPYIGQVTLDTDEVMGKTIHVRYRIDIVTGMCAALISVNQSGSMDECVLYQFSGHCSINMPINSADFSGYIGAAMTAGKMVAGVVAGASGNMALAAELTGAPAPHSSTSETMEKKTERNPKTGRQVTTGTSTRTTTHTTPGASFGEMARKATSNTVSAVMGSKLTVEHAGGFTGNSGYLAVRRPYLIIERPRMCNPQEYGKYNGRPSMIYMSLSNCSGYTEVQSIQFENIGATNPELSELSELLKTGVIL